MASLRWQDEIPSTIKALARGHFAILEANCALSPDGLATPGEGDRQAVIDAAMVSLTRAKWLFGRATGENADHSIRTNSADDLIAARKEIEKTISLARSSTTPDDAALDAAAAELGALSSNGTEILWSADVPIVPAIAPIVVLHGSSRDMGYQYAQQCLEIFGRFIFEQVAAKDISGEALTILRHWEGQLREHTPEMLDMARGMAEGATSAGLALGYEQALSMITDLRAPATEPLPVGVLEAEGGGLMGSYFGDFTLGDDDEQLVTPADGPCSGAAAWGSATPDGRACFASSTDHDADFQVTIVAFPDDGHAFVHTPFVANGALSGVGRFGLAGHPAINTAGLTYVHHGGGGSCNEPVDTWGYGVPRGASTMHIMRYADTARQARDAELSMPVGDTARLLGSVGGFYVDDTYGYVIEDRTPGRPVIREHTPGPDGSSYDFLFATNNLQSPELGEAFCPPAGGYLYEPEAGWYTREAEMPDAVGAGASTRQFWAQSSEMRNRALHSALSRSNGSITVESLADLWRSGPRFDEDGVMTEGSVGHRNNAFVAFGSAATGQYSGALGMIAPRTSQAQGHGYFYLRENGTHWDLQLGEGPAALAADARATAEREIRRAEERTSGGDTRALAELMELARTQLNAGVQAVASVSGTIHTQAAAYARATRAFTRAQVYARQVSAS